MSKDSHVIAQNTHLISMCEGENFRFSSSWKKFNFSTLFSDFSSVVCTAEISVFHTFFLCFFEKLEIFHWCLSALAINFLFPPLWFPFLCPRLEARVDI